MCETIPGSIVKAICKIKSVIEAVPKRQKNPHGNYAFASTDDIYGAITRRMGEVGLCIISEEVECDVVRIEKDGKTTQWLKATYAFILATEDATWTSKNCKRTVFVLVNGPQTFQGAQSYCEKSFYRSLLQLPTGDQDLDGMPQADTEEDQVALAGNGKKRKSSSGAKKDGTSELFNEIRGKLQQAPTRDYLQQVRTLYADDWDQMPARWHELLEHEYEDRLMSFGPMAAE